MASDSDTAATSSRVHPVILSGGAGSRLWPLSRSSHPKQFFPILGQRTLLQETALRVQDSRRFAPVLVIAGEEHRFMVSHQLRDIGAAVDSVILEPDMRSTAPAIALAAHRLLETQGPSAVMLVMPSDHVIGRLGAFHEAVARAVPAALKGSIVAFGVVPHQPETGFGYIEQGDILEGLAPVRQIRAFVEKPSRPVAETFLAGGCHFWNAGIFLMTAGTYLDNLAQHAPDILRATAAAMASPDPDSQFLRPNTAAFEASPSLSIDYAVMEKCETAAVVPVDMGWSDLGSWDALWDIRDKDADGNARRGDVLAIDCHDSLFHVEGGPAVAACGVEGLVVVSTQDSVLVIPKARSQDVKAVVEALKQSPDDRHSIPPVVHRPWGTYEPIGAGGSYQVKRIVVEPGASLSLQLHRHRSEHWIVVSGTARVTVGAQVSDLTANQSTYIPAGTPHRLENPSDEPLQLIEVQCGSYLGEDDIVRLADSYGRAAG